MPQDEFVVFYAWQSDLPTRQHRNFVEKCLKLALKDLGESGSIESSPRLDKDTQGVPGLPDIANTILDKIRGADAFVADVSFVSKIIDGTTHKTLKLVPNPNVMIELGYALAELTWERIILVLNTLTGSPDELPFDLRNRRWPLTYELGQEASDEDRIQTKEKLSGELQEAVEAIAKLAPRQKRATTEQRLSALETMVSSLSGASAQYATLAQLIAGLPISPSGPLDSAASAKKRCLHSLDSLIRRVVSGEFHEVAVQQGLFVACIQPTVLADQIPLFHSKNESTIRLGLQPFGATGWDHRTFGDRFVTMSGAHDEKKDAATEILLDGTINAAGHDVLATSPTYWSYMNRKPPEGTVAIPSVAFERQVIEAITRYLKCLRSLGVKGPWLIALAAINIQKSILFVSQNFMFSGRPYLGNEIRLPLVEVPEDTKFDGNQAVAHALRPAFDFLWREHNFPRSLNYAETGDWVGQ